MNIRVKILSHLAGVFSELQPDVGEVYEANYKPPKKHNADICIIKVNGKKICLKPGEYEICESE